MATITTYLRTAHTRPAVLARLQGMLGSLSAQPLVLAVLLAFAAFGLRAVGVTRSYDLWVDEMVYADLGASASRGELPSLTATPFFLHPPGAFILEGFVIRLFAISGDAMSMVYELRWMNAILGGVTVGLAFLLVRKVSSTAPALFTAAVLTLDPFVLRNNSRLFLETPGIAAVLAGLLLLVIALSSRERRAPLWLHPAAGLLLGWGVFTKDALVVCTLVPVVLAGFWRRTLAWRQIAIVLGSSLLPYTVYVALLGSAGFLDKFASAKSVGIERMLGLVQTTGFNAPGAPSLIDRMLEQIETFGTSYVILCVGPVGIIAALSPHPGRRLIGLSAASMGLLGVYAAAFGTFEEHYGYGIAVLGAISAGVVAAEIRERRPSAHKYLSWLLVGFAATTAILGIRAQSVTDDGIRSTRQWIEHNLPVEARVGVTTPTAQWAFREDGRFGIWPSARSLHSHNANYVITQSLQTRQGYGYAEPALLDWLEGNAQPLFTSRGRTNGETVVWHISPDRLKAAATEGIGSK